MTRWICNRGAKSICGEPCYIEYPGDRPKHCLYEDGRCAAWEKDCGKAIKRIVSIQDANIEEMKRILYALEERVVGCENYKKYMQDSAEGVIHSLLERVETLEKDMHLMQRHGHNASTGRPRTHQDVFWFHGG